MSPGKIAIIILARAGSKRLPGKNRLPLGNKPLHRLALEAGLQAGVFSPVVVSTDDELILQDIQDEPGVTALRRDPVLARDDTVAWDVCRHLFASRQDIFSECTSFCLITPCHPFRTASHLVQAVEAYERSGADALVSMSRYPFPPELAVTLDGEFVRRKWTGAARKDDHPIRFHPNGAIVICSLDAFLKHAGPYTDRTIGFELAWPFSLDIDTPEDFKLAQLISKAMPPEESQ